MNDVPPSTVTSAHTRAVVAHYDRRAASYDESAMHRRLAGVVAAQPEVAEASAVLDVATGTGLVLRAIATERPGRLPFMVGIDLSPGMLAVARAEMRGTATFLAGDAAGVLLPDASFDLITCVTGLHLIEDPDVAIAEWARLLEPGGLVVTATFAAVPPGGSGQDSDGLVRRHEPFRTPEQVAGLATPHGLHPVRHLDWSHGEVRLLICLLRRM